MDEGVYVRVFPWRSSEARLSQAAGGNSQHIGRESRGGRRERRSGTGIAAFLLTTGTTRLPKKTGFSVGYNLVLSARYILTV